MNTTLKSLAFLLGILCFPINVDSASNPHQFIDSQAQEMVSIIRNNQDLYAKDPELFKDKINVVFEPMVDFRRVGASVMGKKYYLAASSSQRLQFIQSFKTSLLDTYSSTLAQWGDQKIITVLLFLKKKTTFFLLLCKTLLQLTFVHIRVHTYFFIQGGYPQLLHNNIHVFFSVFL